MYIPNWTVNVYHARQCVEVLRIIVWNNFFAVDLLLYSIYAFFLMSLHNNLPMERECPAWINLSPSFAPSLDGVI